MKRLCALILSLLLILPAQPFSALAADGDPLNVVAVGEARLIRFEISNPMYDIATESLNPDIVSVFYQQITGVSPGLGTVRATFSVNGEVRFTQDIPVRVYPAPTSVTLNETAIQLGAHEIGLLSYTIPDGSFGRVTYTTDNPSITVDQNDEEAEIHADAPCEGNVTATAFNGVSATCHVKVVPGPTDITLSPTLATMFVGQTLPLTAQATGGYTRDGVIFSSDNKTVCTVSKDGVITAVKAGEATITARAYNGYDKECHVTVYDEPDSIHFSGIPSRIGLGEMIPFTPRDSQGNALLLNLSVSDPSVLSLQYGRYVTGEKVGSCTVTASSATKSASFTITVCPAPHSIALDPASVTLKEVETVTLTPVFSEGAASSTILYDTSNFSVAKVSEDGVVTAQRPGRATISARTYNARYAYCEVTVLSSDITYTLTPTQAEVGIGRTVQLHLTDPNGNAIPATYKSSNTTSATVDDTGLVTGQWNGPATITATVADGREYTAHINVVTIPESITASPTSMTLRVGQTGYYQIDSDVNEYFDATAVSSNPQVVYIDLVDANVWGGGSFDAVGTGSATVTITSFNGKKATLAVTVLPAENVIASAFGSFANLYYGQTKNLDVRDIHGNPVACTYTSSNPNSVKVDSKGNITSGSVPGNYSIITAKAADGRTCKVNVSLYIAPSYLYLDVSSLSMHAGDTHQLILHVQPGTMPFDITYSTSSSKVATVSKNGLITPKGLGKCTNPAQTFNGKTGTVSVTVGSVPTSITVSPATMTLGLNETRKLSIALPSGAVDHYSLFVSDPGIVEATEDGKVTGLALGSVTFTARTSNNKTDTCQITVRNAPGSITLTAPAKTLGLKETMQLKAALPSGTAGAITYTSSNTKIATVSATGKVTGIAIGTVTITAKTYNGKTAKVSLQVKKAPASIKLNLKAAKMGVGETTKLTATLSSGSAGAYTFKSSSTKIATVDGKGNVKAIAPGKATITATTYNGRKAICTVTVYKQPGSISAKSTYTLRRGRYFTWAVRFPSGTYSHLTFTSDKPSIAKVDSAGRVTGVKAGTAVITATAFNGKTTRCVVTVK